VPDNEQKQRISVRQALSLSFVQRLVGLVFSFGSVVIISRLLTPAEVGVFSVAAGFVALINMLRDFGVSEFVVQEPVLNEALVRTVFTMNLVIAWSLGGIIVAASGVIGMFYGDPGVTRVLKVLGFVFFLLPFGTTAMALLNRELEYAKLAKIRIGESIVRSCTAVALAYAGFTYMSIAWASVAGISALIIGCTIWGWQYRVKGLSFSHWKRVLHFGSNRTISDIASQLGDQSASLVIGKMLGMTDTGLFSRGYGVVNLYRTNVLGAIESVAFPAFAREHRETARAPELFRKALVYTTGISWPFFASGAILAYPVINILFGDQWNAAVPLMRWLCVAALVGTLTYQCNRFLVALGRVTTVTRVEVRYQLARIGITIVAAFYGVAAVAASQILVYVIATVLYYRQMRIYDALKVRKCARALVPSVVVTLATCVVPAVIVLWPGLVARHMVLAFVVSFLGGGAGWLLAVVFAPHPLLDEIKRIAARVFAQYHRSRGQAVTEVDAVRVLNARFDCTRCHASGSWVPIARSLRRQNSVIHQLRCVCCPERIVAKVGRGAGLHDDALAQSRREYEALCALQRVFPQDKRYGTLVPLDYLESAGNGIVITRYFRGGDLGRRLRSLNASGRREACRSAGIWLRKLHESGDSGMQRGVLGVADKLDYLASTYGDVLGADAETRKAWELLAQEAARADMVAVRSVRLHGDFKPENMLCDGTKYVGLDIDWRNVGAAVYDLAPFLNHLRLAGRVMGHARADRLLTEAEFMAGYGGSVPVRALRWAQLYFALCYLGGHRAHGRLTAIYAHLRVRPLVLDLARRLQEAA